MPRHRRSSKIIAIHPCDDRHQIVTITTPGAPDRAYCTSPCAQCPWRKDSPIGAFPVEAYRHSAITYYDMAKSMFACHMSGREKASTCAGFLLSRGAAHNLLVRLALMDGRLDLRKVKSDVALYQTYQDMAIANGVARDDPVLGPCRI